GGGGGGGMNGVEVVKLTALMERTTGGKEVRIGLIDGPVAMGHAELEPGAIQEVLGKRRAQCTLAHSLACLHGTFVAGILSAKRGSPAPAICPGCTLLVRPIFVESTNGMARMPSATPDELAEAIVACVAAGARVLNLSVAI